MSLQNKESSTGQDRPGKRIEVAQLNEQKVSPWIQFLPAIRGLLSAPAPAWVSQQVCHLRVVPCAHHHCPSREGNIKHVPQAAWPRASPGGEDEGVRHSRSPADVVFSLFFPSVLIKTPHVPKDRRVKFTLESVSSTR